MAGGKKTLNLSVSIWYMPRDGHIRMRIKGKQKDRITTISENPDSKRYHPHLFQHLKDELAYDGKWDVA